VGATIVGDRGKGGHVMVVLAAGAAFVPTGGRELRLGPLHAMLRDLAITLDRLRRR
jgi:hypothetical protein